MHRGTALAFATDARALAAARQAVKAGWDMGAPEPERQFFYMPFEHSENTADQELAVRLLTERLASDPEMALHARVHQVIIAQFGRFPYRNAALGRDTTPAEAAFMAAGCYAADVERHRRQPVHPVHRARRRSGHRTSRLDQDLRLLKHLLTWSWRNLLNGLGDVLGVSTSRGAHRPQDDKD
jgi:hypothetical protein